MRRSIVTSLILAGLVQATPAWAAGIKVAVVAPVGALVAFVATVTPSPETNETIIELRSRNRRLR